MKKSHKVIVWFCALSFPIALGYTLFKRIPQHDLTQLPSTESVIAQAIAQKRMELESIDAKVLATKGELLKLEDERNAQIEKLQVLKTELDDLLEKKPETTHFKTSPKKSLTEAKEVDTKMGRLVAVPLPREEELNETLLEELSDSVATESGFKGIYVAGLKNQNTFLKKIRTHFSRQDYEVPRLEVEEFKDNPVLLFKR